MEQRCEEGLGRGRGREDSRRRAGVALGSKELGARLGGAVGNTWCMGACTRRTGPKSMGLRVTLARAAVFWTLLLVPGPPTPPCPPACPNVTC